MDEKQILSHCAIVEVTKCEYEKYWYADLVGKQLVAFGFDEDDNKIYCCHKDNTPTSMAILPLEHSKFIKGSLGDLYDMS